MSAKPNKTRLRVLSGGLQRDVVAADVGRADASDLAKVAAGDLGALGAVYDRHATGVLDFAYRAIGAADAPDILQMTFVRAARIAGTFDASRGTARRWLIAIAARLVMDRRRSLFRQARAFLGLENAKAGLHVRPVGADHLDVIAALEALPPETRVVVLLAEVEGYKCEEIAKMLEVPIGTVWTRLHRARKSLRATLGGGEDQ